MSSSNTRSPSALARILRWLIPPSLRPIGYLTDLTRRRTGCVVQSGPFVGMRYVNRSTGSAYIPKLLGTYERELTPVIETLISLQPKLIVDIGAAEGYYAVGLARRLDDARISAFEMEAEGRQSLVELATLSGVVDRIQLQGRCEPDDLIQALGEEPSVAVVCDVEGYEETLLDPKKVPALRKAAILVELHEFIVPQIRQILTDRFSGTHKIELIWQEERQGSEFPWRTFFTRLLPRKYINWAVSEWRPVKMNWLWMQPLSS